ncbi:MAG: ATP-binding protein [Bryobacterales bacterium]|nr:ATP-binding protein [Bryobacterales bacterium]
MADLERLVRELGLRRVPARLRKLPQRSGQRVKRLVGAGRGIAVQMYLGLLGAVALTIMASVVALISFNEVRESQEVMNQRTVPDMAAAFAVAQRVGALVDAAPALTVVDSIDLFEERREQIGEQLRVFEESLQVLAGRRGESEGIRRIRVRGREMSANMQAIEVSQERAFELAGQRTALGEQIERIDAALANLVITIIDDQFFYTMTGYVNLGEPPLPRATHFTEQEVMRYRLMAELREGTAVTSQLVANALAISDEAQLRTLLDRFEAASSRTLRNLNQIGELQSGDEIIALFRELFDLSTGPDGLLEVRQQELELLGRQGALLDRNREIATDLVVEVESLVAGLRSSTQLAAQSSTEAIQTAIERLLGLNLVALAGAALIGWLFVGRHLLRRLRNLSSTMLTMAGGDLEKEVEVEGSDEVADMAQALEVFRRHALEVQRLNLVEKLAEDLKSKNLELEGVLVDLRTAQDQIVMREKLAALGELTAGVAHEIKNPLNFVKNFSEVSQELLAELQEALPQGDEPLAKDKREELADICEYLTGNLERIHGHGERANRIVNDMLMMGRGSSEWRPTAINSLVSEHANLAYHSARATDSDFQLNIEEDFDERVGEVDAVPQDLGRVVLNMVSNACHATNERRVSGEAGYSPTLRIRTLDAGDRYEIRIRDNGHGIPDEVLEKVFNPFFTTKPTDQGTGLGLALSNDIVREHGGEIRVDTAVGEFTEMIVDLPKRANVEARGDGEDEATD